MKLSDSQFVSLSLFRFGTSALDCVRDGSSFFWAWEELKGKWWWVSCLGKGPNVGLTGRNDSKVGSTSLE